MRVARSIFFIIGIMLLALSVFGLFKSMRNPAVFDEEKTLRNRLNDITIGYPEVNGQLERKAGESDLDFGVRINAVVNKAMIHYWKEAGTEKYHLRVPVWENYLLFGASYVCPKNYGRYEFSRWRKNLERGVGLCSTHSTVVKGVLLENGIKAELMDVGGHHVVVRAELNDTATWILDPDFGVVVPFDTAAITANPELVRKPFARMADLYYPDAVEPYTTDYMVEIFGNRKYIYSVENSFEDFSYRAMWILPLLLMLPFMINRLRRAK